MLDDDMEAQLRGKAEREGERLFTPDIQQMLARELQQAKRLVLDDSVLCGFRIGGEAKEYLFVEFLGREHPDRDDFWDGNWLITRVSVAVGAFRGSYRASLRTDEVARFLAGLRTLYTSLGTAIPTHVAEFHTLEEQLTIHVEGDGLGHFTATCVAVDDAGTGNKLEFELSFDQTHLPRILDDLCSALKAFPVKGSEKGSG